MVYSSTTSAQTVVREHGCRSSGMGCVIVAGAATYRTRSVHFHAEIVKGEQMPELFHKHGTKKMRYRRLYCYKSEPGRKSPKQFLYGYHCTLCGFEPTDLAMGDMRKEMGVT